MNAGKKNMFTQPNSNETLEQLHNNTSSNTSSSSRSPLVRSSDAVANALGVNDKAKVLHGMDAIIRASFPNELIAKFVLLAYKYNLGFALRAGQPAIVYKGYTVSPKPLKIKAKSFNAAQGVKFLEGTLPINPIYRRVGSAPLPQNIEQVQFIVRLEEILADAEKNNYSNVIISGKYLEFYAHQADDEGKREIIYSIDLSQPIDPEFVLLDDLKPNEGISPQNNHEPRVMKACENLPWKKLDLINETVWEEIWNKSGVSPLSFAEAKGKLYPAYFQKPHQEREPLMVAAHKGHVISGDVDLLWVAIPQECAHEMKLKLHDTSNHEAREALLRDFITLASEIDGKVPSTLDAITGLYDQLEEFICTAGTINPVELLSARLINLEFNNNFPYYKNPIQHGADTANPHPCSLDDTILHIHVERGEDNEPIITMKMLTCNEFEAAKMAERLIEKGYFININHQWNMDIWAPVIQKQLAYEEQLKREGKLGENESNLRDETLASYYAFINTGRTPMRRPSLVDDIYKEVNEIKKPATFPNSTQSVEASNEIIIDMPSGESFNHRQKDASRGYGPSFLSKSLDGLFARRPASLTRSLSSNLPKIPEGNESEPKVKSPEVKGNLMRKFLSRSLSGLINSSHPQDIDIEKGNSNDFNKFENNNDNKIKKL